MENLENQNIRPEVSSDAENFDAKGNPRSRHEMRDGTIALLSEEEYKDELERQND